MKAFEYVLQAVALGIASAAGAVGWAGYFIVEGFKQGVVYAREFHDKHGV